jgi:hypothetical protein
MPRAEKSASAGWLYRSIESGRSYARENREVTQVKQSLKGAVTKDAENLPRNRKV